MNMLARVLGTVGHPVRTVKRFLALTRGARLGSIPRRPVPLLSVREASGLTRYGYIFGSELAFNALTMYERFGQGYLGLARFLWEVSAGYTLRTDLWYRFGHLLDAPKTPLVVDGVLFPRYAVAVAKGLVTAIPHVASPGSMNALTVLPTEAEALIGLIPSLMIGAPADGVLRSPAPGAPAVRHMALKGPYTLDGERFDRHAEPPEAPLEVMGTERVLWGVDLS
jgi:hypothetical protein